MSKDPIEELGNEQLFVLAADLEVQLEKGTGTRPVLYLLIQARKKAATALIKLVEVDAIETNAIRSLQAEVRLYSDMVQSCQELIVRGAEADRLIHENDRIDMAEIVGSMSPEEQRLYGVQTKGDD